jgi:hypothetical protein
MFFFNLSENKFIYYGVHVKQNLLPKKKHLTAAEKTIVGIITTRVAEILTWFLSVKSLKPASSNHPLFVLKPSSFSYKKKYLT